MNRENKINGEHILDLAIEYARKSGEGQLKVCSMVSEQVKVMGAKKVEEELVRKIKECKTIWTLEEGDTCFIIKETGEVIETIYIDNKYFRNVRRMGNLKLTYQEAHKEVVDRMRGHFEV